jgi:hypothetical protein
MNRTFLLMILLSTLYMECMEKSTTCLDKEEKQLEQAQQTSLLCLPDEIENHIISYCYVDDEDRAKSLELSIKTFMKLSCISKYFNIFFNFKTIGNLCKDYYWYDKYKVFSEIVKLKSAYYTQRRCALILVCAEANITIVDSKKLLKKALLKNDVEFVSILLKHDAGMYMKDRLPIFFHAKTIKMAQIFIDHNVNIHCFGGNRDLPNILWFLLKDEYAADLMEFYIKCGVSVKAQCCHNDYCLLHGLARSEDISDSYNFLKKAEIILNAMPSDMVNARTGVYKRTPLDIAQDALESAKRSSAKYGVYEQLIALLKTHGGLYTHELEELAKKKQEKKRCDCIIF